MNFAPNVELIRINQIKPTITQGAYDMKTAFCTSLFKNLNIFCACFGAVLFAANAWSYGQFNTPATAYIKSGDSLILNQEISVRSGARIYLQFGEAMLRSKVEEAKPFCYFHLYRDPSVIDTSASLVAGDFTISKTVNHYDMGFLHGQTLELAFNGFITQDASQRIIITRFTLESAEQPEVIGLNCGIWAVPNERNHLTIDEIRTALGDLVTLRLQGE